MVGGIKATSQQLVSQGIPANNNNTNNSSSEFNSRMAAVAAMGVNRPNPEDVQPALTNNVTAKMEETPSLNDWDILADQISAFVQTLGRCTWKGFIKNDKGHFDGCLNGGEPIEPFLIHVDNGVFVGCSGNGFSDCEGALVLNFLDMTYTGGIRNGRPHGKGYEISDYGFSYNGDYVNGTWDGHGVFKYSDGSIYDGEWKGNKRNGNGVHKYLTGFSYEGGWEADKRSGKGKLTYPSDFVGTILKWKDSVLVTELVEKNLESSFYYGEWREDQKNGMGVFKWADGSWYSGSWKDGRKNGHGEYHCSDGSSYIGEWEDDMPSGNGTWTGIPSN